MRNAPSGQLSTSKPNLFELHIARILRLLSTTLTVDPNRKEWYWAGDNTHRGLDFRPFWRKVLSGRRKYFNCIVRPGHSEEPTAPGIRMTMGIYCSSSCTVRFRHYHLHYTLSAHALAITYGEMFSKGQLGSHNYYCSSYHLTRKLLAVR